MARPLRIEFANACYHVTSRGNACKSIYKINSDRRKFLNYLSEAKNKYRFKLYAYVLMTNHYHLILETPDPNLNRIMQYLNSSYANYFKTRHKQIGHIFQGRYKALLIEKDTYLLELIRYVHLNPVRAGITENLMKYPWSSLGEYLQQEKEFVDVDDILPFFGKGKREAIKAVITFLSESKEYNEAELEWLKKPYGGYILGKREFIKIILKQLKEKPPTKDTIRSKEMEDSELLVEKILNVTANEFKLTKETILNSVKKGVQGRDVAIYLIKKLTGLKNDSIGDLFGGISYSAISHAASRIEKEKVNDKDLIKKIEKINSQFKV